MCSKDMSVTSLLVFMNNLVAFPKEYISFLMLKVQSRKSGISSFGSLTYEILKPYGLLVTYYRNAQLLANKEWKRIY